MKYSNSLFIAMFVMALLSSNQAYAQSQVSGSSANEPTVQSKTIEFPFGVHSTKIGLKSELSHQEIYPDMTIYYVVEVETPASLHFSDIQAPSHPGTDIKFEYSENQYYFIDFDEFRKTRYHFSIKANKVGSLVLEGATLTYINIDNEGRRHSEVITTPSFSLNSLAIPDAYQGYWLPSSYVSLSEEWSKSPAEVVLGDIVTRTIHLTIAERTLETFPSLTLPKIAGVSVYHQDKVFKKTKHGTRMSLSQTVIPRSHDSIVLPGIELPWFNTTSSEIEIASIKQRTLFPSRDNGPSTSLFSMLQNIDTSLVRVLPLVFVTLSCIIFFQVRRGSSAASQFGPKQQYDEFVKQIKEESATHAYLSWKSLPKEIQTDLNLLSPNFETNLESYAVTISAEKKKSLLSTLAVYQQQSRKKELLARIIP